MIRYFPLRVAAVKRDTRDAVIVTLEPEPAARAHFRFLPGQHLNLRARVGGEELRRSYSICAAPSDGVLRIAIKRAAGGRFSNWANDTLQAGMTLEALPPAGRFHTPLDPAARRHYLAIAAGSGITPVFSLLKTGLEQEPHSQWTLWYGNRASGAVMLREELAELKDTWLGRFTLLHVLSREPQDIDLLHGRLTPERCSALLDRWHRLEVLDQVYLCGPPPMNADLAAMLTARGFPPGRILSERFANARQSAAAAAPPAGEAGAAEVELVLDGRRHHFPIKKRTETILDAGLRHGIDLRHSCKSGVCATCRAKLLEGEVDMDGNFALEDYEIARGFILTCQSYPVTDRVVVDFDQDT